MNYRLYPLKFDPIYQYRLWGGRRLAQLLHKPLPNEGPVGEAWLLSDRKDHASQVLNGPLAGQTLTELLRQYPKEIMGSLEGQFDRFPLLLKFLDCNEVLSVQVHPSDGQTAYIPPGDTGKTEAWVVLEASADGRIYAGLKEGTTEESLEAAIAGHTVSEMLHSFVPKVGDGLLIQSGTVHTLGGAVVFEVQENSDVTFRLYDWDRIDPKTGKPRELQVQNALACIDYNQVALAPIHPLQDKEDNDRDLYFDDEHFKVWRMESSNPIDIGTAHAPTVLVCIGGEGMLSYAGTEYQLSKGEVMLLPAAIGGLQLLPQPHISLLYIAIPPKE